MKKVRLVTLLTSMVMTQFLFAQSIVISEISYNGPESGSDTTEFIELYNNSLSSINMSGYTFSQGVTYTFPSFILGPGAVVVVAVDSVAIQNVFGVAALQWTGGGLSNSGEDVTLKDNMGNTIDSVDYDDNSPWPVGPPSPDGGGPTIELTDVSLDNNLASNWTVSTTSVTGVIVNGLQVYGTPGMVPTMVAPIVASAVVDSNISCNGFADGGATASATGGTMPYTYSWSNAATTAAITGVVAGTYTVTITDSTSATATSTITISEPLALITNVTIDSNVTTIGGADGGATASATGGTMPYTYLWNNAATTASITGVMVGTYTVTITDGNGCLTVDSATISGPAAVFVVMGSSNVSCFGFADGTAKVSSTGGVTPYTYLWNNAATTDSIGALIAGTYSVTVTDNAGVTAIDSIQVTEPPVIQTVFAVTNASATGTTDGSIDLTVTGGTPGFTYLWSNASTTQDILNLSAGMYIVTVTDTNGCQLIDSAQVIEPGVLANLVITEINYNGPESGLDTSEFIEFTNTGSTTVNLNGYTFPEGITHTFTANDSITAGQYFVIAFDSTAFRNRYGIDADAVWTAGGLSNGGEDIIIADDFGRGIDTVDFDDSAPWPINSATNGPDGNGSSIELQTALTSNNNDGVNWVASALAVPGVTVNGFQVFASPGNPNTTGINTATLAEEELRIYPNPTKDMITIERLNEGLERIQLVSINGKVLNDNQSVQSTITMDLSNHSNGVYFLRVGNETRKIILAR